MKPRLFFALFALSGAGLAWEPPASAQGTDSNLSPERLEVLDQHGYFTPAFKEAVHDLVDTRQAVVQAKADEAKLEASLPALQTQSSAADAEVASLQKELAGYAHPEDADFDALQNAMKSPVETPQDRLALAQAFVWSYPTDPHQAEAVQYLQQIQKQMADQAEAEKEAEAARVAARAKLIQRAEAKDLSLAEWKSFLQDMSQEDLLTYLGRPQTQQADSWTYAGPWTSDPITNQKVGLQIFFNGTRVMSVTEAQP
jgi:hypothetical protein